MSIKALSWVFDTYVHGSGAKITLLALANYANDSNHAYPSQNSLAKMTSLSTRAIRNHITELERLGFITRSSRKRADGTFTSDLFRLNVGFTPSNTVQRNILPSEENGLNQRQDSTYPAADFAGHDPALKEEPLLKDKEKEQKEKAATQPPGFVEFWKIYPKAAAKKPCLEMWKKRNFEAIAETILDDVRRKSKTEAWTKENGMYVPMSKTYLNQERWNDKQQEPQLRERGFVV